MRITKDKPFLLSLQNILSHIADDSLDQAILFDQELENKIAHLVDMPWQCRQSWFHSRPNIRDLIYKGYVIPYLIDEDKDLLVVLNIFTHRNY